MPFLMIRNDITKVAADASCSCPQKAIEYGKKSVGKPRCHFEALGM